MQETTEKPLAMYGFDENKKWPDFSDTLWGECIHNYYDFTPPWREGQECGCESTQSMGHTSCRS